MARAAPTFAAALEDWLGVPRPMTPNSIRAHRPGIAAVAAELVGPADERDARPRNSGLIPLTGALHRRPEDPTARSHRSRLASVVMSQANQARSIDGLAVAQGGVGHDAGMMSESDLPPSAGTPSADKPRSGLGEHARWVFRPAALPRGEVILPAWLRPNRGEQRWSALGVIIAAIGLQIALPDEFVLDRGRSPPPSRLSCAWCC